MDLPEHGDAPHRPAPHTVDKMVDAIAAHAETAGAPSAILGHSFGGKVAAVYGHRFGQGLKACIVVDSAPEPPGNPPAHEGLVPRVIETLGRCPGPFSERAHARTALKDAAIPDAIVAWLLTALKRGESGWRWSFHLEAMAPLLASYRATDLWSLLEDGGQLNVPYTVVCAGREGRWTTSHLEQLQRLEARGRVRHHLFEDSGHWIHVDKPNDLLRVIANTLNP